jgi:Ca2+:H+ antiporter
LVRRILFALLALGPLVIVLNKFTDVGDIELFVLAAVALVPLAWLIGEATEHAAHHTGPGIGGFLNATFGNAPELIIALIAVNSGLTEVVRGSLTGSVIGNLLLVLGFSLVFGGSGRLDRKSSLTSFALVAFAVVLFLIPSIPGWEGDPDRHSLAVASVPVSIVLHSLEVFAEEVGLTEFFVAAVIVAIVGNAAEHGGAVVVAYRGNIKLAAEIALASSAQVAVFLIPVVALVSWFIEPLSLAFRQVEIIAVAGSVVFTALLLFNGRSSRWRGAALIAAYVAVACAFYAVGDR